MSAKHYNLILFFTTNYRKKIEKQKQSSEIMPLKAK